MPSKLSLLLSLLILSSITLAQTTITYQTNTGDFANPERGFYRYSETRSANYTLLDQSTLEAYRVLHTPPSAGYSIYSTLVFRYFFLEDFKTANISQTYLDNIQADFNTARAAGVKLIPRFAYTDEVDGSGCSAFICPPYGDADKPWVLTHIAQLQPVLEANKDVIAAVQMGLVGVWGENYYTDFFGDASQAPDYKLVDANWTDRIEVLNELLNAVPDERMVQVRYPQKKQRAIYGINAPTSSTALTQAEAYMTTNKARLGFHNDCLLASADDFGTFTDYGNSSTNSMSDTTNLKPYLAADSKFVVVGGETCSDGYSPQNDCASADPAAYGDTELERMHYSYLNSQYNNDVNNDWVTDACMDDIKKRLGYRFELQEGTYSDAAQPGQVITVDLDLKNEGYAAPYNERGVELILRNTMTSDLWYAALPDDPRFWFAQNAVHNITESLCIPAAMPLGIYELLLNLPDPMPALYPTPAYAIRLANLLPDNSDVWESTTGYNQLGHTITIDNTSANMACSGEIVFTPTSTILPVELVDFKASPQGKSILISWSTASELNNAGFAVQRSLNGKDFTEIAWQSGQVTSNALKHYAFTDTKVIENTNYYYRLAQHDLDGKITYSNTVSARLYGTPSAEQFAESISIYPNPVVHEFTIRGTFGLYQIEIINSSGQLMQSIDCSGDEHTLDLSTLPTGLYFVRIFNFSENQFVIRKVIKG